MGDTLSEQAKREGADGKKGERRRGEEKDVS